MAVETSQSLPANQPPTVRGDHVHLLPDVRLLIQQGHGCLVLRTRPLESLIVGAGGQVEVERHVARTGADSIQVNTYLEPHQTA